MTQPRSQNSYPENNTLDKKESNASIFWLTGAEGSGKSACFTLLEESRQEHKDDTEIKRVKLEYLSFEVFQSFISILSNWNRVLPDVQQGRWTPNDIMEMKKRLRELQSEDELPANFRIKREWLDIMNHASKIKGFQNLFVRRHFMGDNVSFNVADGLKELLLREPNKWSILGDEMPPKSLYKYIRYPNSDVPRKSQQMRIGTSINTEFILIDIPGRKIARDDVITFLTPTAMDEKSANKTYIFQEPRGVIFVFSISDFDIYCTSNCETNVWMDGFSHFVEVVNNDKIGERAGFYLLLTKSDIFDEKMKAIEDDEEKLGLFREKLKILNQHYDAFVETGNLQKLPNFPTEEEFRDINTLERFLKDVFKELFLAVADQDIRKPEDFRASVHRTNLMDSRNSKLAQIFEDVARFFQQKSNT